MKKKSLLLSAIFLLGFATPQIAFAADDNKGEQVITVTLGEVALLAIPPVTVGLTLSGATVAGAPAAVALANENSRLRITSVVSSTTRTILAQITTGNAPVGTLLQIEALPAIQNFIGAGGVSTGIKTLSNLSSVEVLNTIGTCNSGILDGDGYVLKYTFGLDTDPATTAAAGSVDMTITYTLSLAS